MGNPEQQVAPIELVDSDTTLVLQPNAIRDQRTLNRGGKWWTNILFNGKAWLNLMLDLQYKKNDTSSRVPSDLRKCYMARKVPTKLRDRFGHINKE
ncbi:hypothetical protein E3N88_18081 [Mikania micrantha]|uniref:Uncharacterized protein n=1 Tax=Mikania micrantha TaxID=192012 RepID=A0A5N6NVW7_9ASTR|nr:hypothetical protein E3N88_18081 [Mikania micrantha]